MRCSRESDRRGILTTKCARLYKLFTAVRWEPNPNLHDETESHRVSGGWHCAEQSFAIMISKVGWASLWKKKPSTLPFDLLSLRCGERNYICVRLSVSSSHPRTRHPGMLWGKFFKMRSKVHLPQRWPGYILESHGWTDHSLHIKWNFSNFSYLSNSVFICPCVSLLTTKYRNHVQSIKTQTCYKYTAEVTVLLP